MPTDERTPPLPSRREVLRFDRFELDVANRELRENGAVVEMQALPFNALALLVERAGQLVSREDLAAVLWPPGTYRATEPGINTAIRKVRRLLGDSAASPVFIQTVPRHGYRFLVPVRTARGEEPVGRGSGPSRGRSGLETPGTRRRAWLAGAGLSLAIAVGGGLVLTSFPGPGAEVSGSAASHATCDGERTVRIAVLPFEAQREGAGRARLARALSEDVAGALWEVEDLRLAAVRVWEESEVDPQTLDYLLAGRVEEPLGETGWVRVDIRLVPLSSTGRAWEGSYEVPISESYLLRARVADDVRSQIDA